MAPRVMLRGGEQNSNALDSQHRAQSSTTKRCLAATGDAMTFAASQPAPEICQKRVRTETLASHTHSPHHALGVTAKGRG